MNDMNDQSKIYCQRNGLNTWENCDVRNGSAWLNGYAGAQIVDDRGVFGIEEPLSIFSIHIENIEDIENVA